VIETGLELARTVGIPFEVLGEESGCQAKEVKRRGSSEAERDDEPRSPKASRQDGNWRGVAGGGRMDYDEDSACEPQAHKPSAEENTACSEGPDRRVGVVKCRELQERMVTAISRLRRRIRRDRVNRLGF